MEGVKHDLVKQEWSLLPTGTGKQIWNTQQCGLSIPHLKPVSEFWKRKQFSESLSILINYPETDLKYLTIYV